MLRRMTVTSLALVPTDRPARYGKQLASHLGRRSVSTWDDETASGTITFDNGLLAMASAAGGLSLTLETDGGSVETLEGVVGRHLVRFGSRDELVVEWSRSDGSAGTTQRLDADADPSDH